ncbi:geranylgeranyl pyrophosphate synthase [Penicillium chrysogenum]|uniref:Geranylgeranyl pyrophosphate synthase n=1 Tax=Penicillium chrysogenum TaxID=5076 RepID=A0ABQ8WRK2_PENCH|nr:geranylgeranyl pyrophosphate synthase [Penicillium chrysogenum]KAJ6157095.1 geranylgeranyl pyrophosphate synthase [Penicillium chrysogenum]
MEANEAIPFPEVPFVSSRPVSLEAMRKAGCFTTFRARLNVRDDLANIGSKRTVNDFEKAYGVQRHDYPPCTDSPGGNMNSLSYPEVLPERLELTTYTTELGFLHDDYTEAENITSSEGMHKRLNYAMNLTNTESPDCSTNSFLMRKIFSAIALECLEVDLQPGLNLLKSYSEQWLKVVDEFAIPRFPTFDEYLEHRLKDSGTYVAFYQIAFGAGICLTKEDFNLMETLFKVAGENVMLTNDYYSWRKERT